MKITDDEEQELPRDGKAFGRLKVRGPAVAKGYFRGEGKEHSMRRAGSTQAMWPRSTRTAT